MSEFPKISLEAARVNAGYTQEKASEMLGVSRSTLQNYEKGKTVPDWSTVRKMEQLYRISSDYLLFT